MDFQAGAMTTSISVDRMRHGYVFNIQPYTLHDGPGIRTMVFLNGCPLRCQWCSNPESQSPLPELGLKVSKCIGIGQCGLCIPVCPTHALTANKDGKASITRDYCNACFACTAECPCEALHVFGSLRSVDEVMQAVEADSVFYGRSGGGMTLSGGEPLLQGEFAIELLREAKRRRIDTAIETCGYVDWQVLKEAAVYTNTVFFDIKCVDAAKHQAFTGVDNTLIMSNLCKLAEQFPQLSIVVRTPLVPGFNDSAEDITRIIEFLRQLRAVTYAVLPYHRLGTPKYEYLGREYPLGDAVLNPETEKTVKELVNQYADSRRVGQGAARQDDIS